MARADAECGYTPRELSRYLRTRVNTVRRWILTGELSAINTSTRHGKARYVILPEHVAEFCRRRAAFPTPRRVRRTKRISTVDYYPE
jgi:hypothetical protein